MQEPGRPIRPILLKASSQSSESTRRGLGSRSLVQPLAIETSKNLGQVGSKRTCAQINTPAGLAGRILAVVTFQHDR